MSLKKTQKSLKCYSIFVLMKPVTENSTIILLVFQIMEKSNSILLQLIQKLVKSRTMTILEVRMNYKLKKTKKFKLQGKPRKSDKLVTSHELEIAIFFCIHKSNLP